MSLGLEHYLFVCFIIGYYIAPLWYKWLQSLLAPSAECKRGCSKKDFQEAAPYISTPSCPKPLLVDALAFQLPSEMRGRIASYCGFRALAAVGGTCRALQDNLWERKEVWHALAAGASLGDHCNAREEAWQARAAFRRAIFRIDVPHLQALSMTGRPQEVLDELVHFAHGLMQNDLTDSGFSEFIRIATRALSAHDPANKLATKAAEDLLKVTHRSMDLFTEEQLERLEYAYKSVHQLHALMVASMKDSYEDILEESFWAHSSAATSRASSSTEVSENESWDSYQWEDESKDCSPTSS